ncbi:MAG TPA: IS110 family transposase [Candidatus Limnocylindrales bacterium]|nr:IS110 family transposase [Candidatus Limnocylindrales bacterium]
MLFLGDDWSEEHHDVELQDETGRVLARAKLPEGLAGMSRLHAMIGEHIGDEVGNSSADGEDVVVRVGIETERGPWVQALIAAGYNVYAINPLQVARYREGDGVSGAKSDPADAHVLADMVRTKHARLRPVAGDSELAEAVKVLTRAHKTLIWEQSRHTLRLRQALLDFFPAAVAAYADLAAPDSLQLLTIAPDPASAARLSVQQIIEALALARRHHRAARAQEIAAVLRDGQLTQPPMVAAAYAASVRAQAAILSVLHTQIAAMEQQVKAHFGEHPDVQVYLSQPGLGQLLGARVLAEFGDDPQRYRDAKARKNYAGTSPITRQSGKRKVVLARWVHNDRLVDAVGLQAFCALKASPGARAYYDRQRARGAGHRAALRQLGNRLVGILHGCLKTGTCYDENTAWAQHQENLAATT